MELALNDRIVKIRMTASKQALHPALGLQQQYISYIQSSDLLRDEGRMFRSKARCLHP
jgi:hypothetical protein